MTFNKSLRLHEPHRVAGGKEFPRFSENLLENYSVNFKELYSNLNRFPVNFISTL